MTSIGRTGAMNLGLLKFDAWLAEATTLSTLGVLLARLRDGYYGCMHRPQRRSIQSTPDAYVCLCWELRIA